MFSLTLISGRSCLQHHYEQDRVSWRRQSWERVCKRVLGREEGERGRGGGEGEGRY